MRAWLLLAALGALPAQAATLRGMTTLDGPQVRLSDLFDDSGANAGRVLGPGPLPGGRIVVEAAQLGAIARQFGVSWRPDSNADRAVLEWPGRPLSRDEALAALRAALVNAGARQDDEIELPGFNPPLIPLEKAISIVVSQLDYDAGSGRFAALLSVAGPRMPAVSTRITGHVDATMDVPVATTRLTPGVVLRADDVRVARVRAASIRGEVVRHAADAVGMQLRRPLAAGQPLSIADLERPALIRRGANVQLELESAGLSLTAQGIAIEAGAAGERIRVLNPVSRAVVQAEVIGPGRVRVAPDTAPLPASAQTALLFAR